VEDFTMNKYTFYIKNHQNGSSDYFPVFASSKEEALHTAKIALYSYQNPDPTTGPRENPYSEYYKEKYADYELDCLYSIEDDCTLPSHHDTIVLPDTKEDIEMAFFNVNWNDYTNSLASIAAPEAWSNDTYPNNGILANYLVHTYGKLKSEKKIITTKEYGLFNTGLFTEYYEPVYAYHANSNPVEFLTEYELGSKNIEEYPERADYFTQPELLLFDWHYKINIQYKHILEDKENRKRIPQGILGRKDIINTLNGSIDTMKKRVSANYKLAVPQYYDGKIQLLLPLCLLSDDKPDLALVVTKAGNTYQGHTCITLDMAYNNARLIARPESNWLNNNTNY